MTSHRYLIHLLAALLALTAPWRAQSQQTRGEHGRGAPPQSCTAVTTQTCTIARNLGRGINLGNMLDAPREGDWGVKFDPAYVDKVAGKFATVRLPVRWSNNAAPTADAKIDEAFARRVDGIVDSLLARGLYVILDLHHYTQISSDKLHPNEFAVDPSVLDERLINLWKQLAPRYKDRSPKLIFELLNEPHGRLNGEPWNTLAPKVLAEVRKTNPTRAVIIGAGEWNSIHELHTLRLPRDRNIIVAIHNYEPFPFTHQGVDFMPHLPKGPTCCDAKQRKMIVDALDKASRWNESSGYPVHLGEFGTYEAADMKSRETYARIVRDEAERRGIGWAYWEFASSFGVYSPKTGEWVEPIRRALLD
jgi:endoglucanase